MMKKLSLTIIFHVMAFGGLQAQQLAQVSQYFSNNLLYNPAVAGAENVIPIQANIRRQWIGITDAPVTQTISGHGFVGMGMGLGAVIHNDATGPTRLTGLSFSAARHFQFQNDMTVSLGISGQIFQYKIDLDKITFDNPEDPILNEAQDTRLTPDASFGAYLYGEQFRVGFSVPNLFQTKVDLFDIAQFNENKVKRHYILLAQGDFDLENQFAVLPSVLGKYLPGVPIQFDITVRGAYSLQASPRSRGPRGSSGDARKRRIWIGASYRTGDAVVAMVGLDYDFFNFGYAYDITTTNVKNYSSGTHEISMGMYLDNPLKRDSKKGPQRRRR